MKRKAQTYSIDAIVAVSVFVVAVIAFFWFLSYQAKSQKLVQITKSAETLSETVDISESSNQTRLAFIEGNQVNEQKLLDMTTRNYTQLKNELGLVHDFCIHFEDEFGNMINISGKRVGIGSSKVKINGTDCG